MAHPRIIGAAGKTERGTCEGTAEERIRDAVRAANRAIFDASNANFRVRGNASTVALLLFEGDVAHIAHVGDSRVYLFRDEALSQLTEDYSLVNWLRN